MLFVNNPGAWGHVYPPFDHAEWHGFTPTDLIFPFFLFIVGVAGVFSLRKRSEAGASRPTLARQAFRRGMTIVLAGWLMAGFPFTSEKLTHLRIPGVLPRIGIVFVLGTWIVLGVRLRPMVLALAAALLLALHTFLLTGLGYDLTPEGNIQRAVDMALLQGHLWKKSWDPEGIVSTISAVATLLTGTLAGLLLGSDRSLQRKSAHLLGWGLTGVVFGELWSLILPINKNLWSGSYVLLSSGFACVALGACVWILDEKRKRPPGFFMTFGRNPLLAFVLSGLFARVLGLIRWSGPAGETTSLQQALYRGGFSWIPDPTLASHAFALAVVLFWWGILRLFDNRGWYWKV